MEKLEALPIDWANVNWPYVIVLALIVFVCILVGTSLSFRRIFLGAMLTALLFAAAYVFWTLPARPAAADEGTGGSTHNACTTTASHCGHPDKA